MIVRIVRGRISPGDLEATRAALSAAGQLPPATRPGLVRSYAGARELGNRLEILSTDFWDTPEAAGVSELGATNGTLDVLSQLLRGVETAHFEVDDTLQRSSAEEPVAIRLTVGRFSQPGSDIEMMELLRRRVPALGPEMRESYVGRRLVGRAVEVTFITTWVAEPADRSLDVPLWPDIALHYDEFQLAVYAPLALPPRRTP